MKKVDEVSRQKLIQLQSLSDNTSSDKSRGL